MYPQDIKVKSLPRPEGIGGLDDLRRVAAFEIGVGNRAVKMDESGIWLGAHKWADAPFRVDMQGNMVASAATFAQYLAKAGTSQSLTGDIQVGIGQVIIDGANKRILINDGTNNRILIGYQSGGF